MALVELTDLEGGPPVIALRGGSDPGNVFRLGTSETDWHAHKRGQLTCIESGLLHIRTARGSWLLPPHRAGWVPPGHRHWGSLSGVLSGWSVLISPEAARMLPDEPAIIGIGPLLRLLVDRVASYRWDDPATPERERLMAVLLDEIRAGPRQKLHLPMPADKRALEIARRLVRAPGDQARIEDLAASAGVSSRTARRLFLAETGMTFAAWRQQARLVQSLEWLAQGEQVAVVSDRLGYAGPSSFIAVFRRAFGETPGRFFERRGGSA